MATHQIYDHGLPKQLAENVWQVTGTLPIPVPRNMTIWRSPEGKLVLYSVIAMHEAGMRALEGLGEPSLIVVPHRRHQMDIPFYRDRYPRVSISMAGLTAFGIPAETIPGTSYEDVAMRLPIPGGHALCVCELLVNMPLSSVAQKLFAPIGVPGGGFGIARAVKWREVRQKERTKRWLIERALDPALRMVLIGHGEPVLTGAGEALRKAADLGLR